MEGRSNEEKRLERIQRLAEKIKKGDFEFEMDDDEYDSRNGTYTVNKTVTLKIYQKDTDLSISLMDNRTRDFVSDVFKPEEESLIMDAIIDNEIRLRNLKKNEESLSKERYRENLFDSMDI